MTFKTQQLGRIGNNGQEIDYTLDSKDMTRIIESATRTLNSKSKDGKNDPDVRGYGQQKNHQMTNHFHVNAFVNGNAIQNGYSVKEAVVGQSKTNCKTQITCPMKTMMTTAFWQ